MGVLSMNLLINEPPLQVLPSLAKVVGLNESIVLQQAHYWLNITKYEFDGYKWFYKTYEDWQKEFPFWSLATVRRVINSLEKQGYLISTTDYNKMQIDKTKWYRIDYQKLVSSPSAQNEQSSCSNCAVEVLKMSSPSAQNDHTNNQRIITKNYTENYSDNVVVDESAQSNAQSDSQKPKNITVFEFYQQNGFGTLSPYVAEKVGAWIDDLSEELVLEAMKIATENNARNWKYVESILKNWHNKNLKTIADVEADRKQFEAKKQLRNKQQGKQKEAVPDWFYERNQNVPQQKPENTKIDFEAERQKILSKLGGSNDNG